MSLNDWLIVASFAALCTLLYLALTAIPRCNRSAGFGNILLAGGAVLVCCAVIWLILFGMPGRPNYGLGGSCLRLAICPLLYLLAGGGMTVYNKMTVDNKRKEKRNDRIC